MIFIDNLLGKICTLGKRLCPRTGNLPTIVSIITDLWLQYGPCFQPGRLAFRLHLLRCGVQVLALDDTTSISGTWELVPRLDAQLDLCSSASGLCQPIGFFVAGYTPGTGLLQQAASWTPEIHSWTADASWTVEYAHGMKMDLNTLPGQSISPAVARTATASRNFSAFRVHYSGFCCFCIFWAGCIGFIPWTDVPNSGEGVMASFLWFHQGIAWHAGRTGRQFSPTVWTCVYHFLGRRASRGIVCMNICYAVLLAKVSFLSMVLAFRCMSPGWRKTRCWVWDMEFWMFFFLCAGTCNGFL
ncbi:hypothetical protein CONLIGDRAFT_286695 [Coniochaeta ligniaria NRRL 30616]|uniref:Uncharacterized protein n=1 Tax=Coniochaeta ligniaria NRRL 30616 TaxID=1408157 RepID=A0A1J7JLC9_9PEZI|nr:hypothetical protein CONLIGDRAFT_286695 [Coniochaeta ligniaria NRRL 30616]